MKRAIRTISAILGVAVLTVASGCGTVLGPMGQDSSTQESVEQESVEQESSGQANEEAEQSEPTEGTERSERSDSTSNDPDAHAPLIEGKTKNGLVSWKIPEGVKFEAMAWDPLSVEGDPTYSTKYGIVLENIREDEIASLTTGEIIFTDEQGNELGRGHLAGLGAFAPGTFGALFGDVDDMPEAPAKIRLEITRIDWRPDTENNEQQYELEVLPGIEHGEKGNFVRATARVTNTHDEPINVTVSALFAGKNKAYFVGGVTIDETIEVGQQKDIDVVGWGHPSQLAGVERAAMFVQVNPQFPE